MFTGLIRCIGTVKNIADRGGVKVLTIAHALERVPRQGDSIALEGICLTALEGADDRQFRAECHYATLAKTSLKNLKVGQKVHLEPAMTLDAVVDGHLVQGHVSALIRVMENRRREGGRELVLSLPRELAGEICREGSVALNGVSLTVASMASDRFSVQLIGETLQASCLDSLKPGDPVNLETDMLLRTRASDLGTAGWGRSGRQSVGAASGETGGRAAGTAGGAGTITEEKLRLWGII
ncbi:MAG: riboflavin synthase [Spirochaetales bacterium]|nr:riboflavin synthase [Spirochaetales bacterium]